MQSFCKYYHGEVESPYEEKTLGRFWHGERLFCMEIDNWEQFIEDGIRFVEWQGGPQHDHQLKPQELAVRGFIVNLYQKWCPMEDLSWLKEY